MSATEFSTSRENISSNGGLSFVEGLPSSTGAMPLWDEAPPHRGNARFSHQAIVRALVRILSAGCGNFADIEKFSDAPVSSCLPWVRAFLPRNTFASGSPFFSRLAGTSPFFPRCAKSRQSAEPPQLQKVDALYFISPFTGRPCLYNIINS